MKTLMICTLQIKEIGGARSTIGGGGRQDVHIVLVGKPDEKSNMEDPRVDGRIILKCIFQKWERAWAGLIWLRTGTGGGVCERGNETSGFHRVKIKKTVNFATSCVQLRFTGI
jgi:hypothetical protein